jgi:asparagine N-glycosylation enzyme membrane subunit Stt3
MDKDDEEITIDFGKIKDFFSKSGKEEKEAGKDLAEEEKELKEELKREREEIRELTEEKRELEKEEEHVEEQIEEKKEQVEQLQTREEPPEEEKSDDDITLDFSKIKKFFKSSTKEPKAKETEEEDVSIDFTKVKRFFKSDKAGSDDDITFNIKTITSFFVKYRLVFLVLIPFLISMNLRMYPDNLPATDDWATRSVHDFFRNQISADVEKRFPNLPDANKNQLVAEEFDKFLKEQSGQVEQQIVGTSQYFKSRLQDESGQTYLLAIDPYFWWRHAKNIVDHGYPGDKIVNGQQIDDHMIAPLGRVVPGDMFHAYLEAYTFKFLRFFNRDLDLMKVAFFMPVILASLSVIPAFFIGRRFGGNLSGFIAATLVAIHPAFLGRTAGGFSDTDSYNVLFPLLITWLVILALDARDMKSRITFGGLAGLLVGMYSFAWGGWWFVFLFLFGMIALLLVYQLYMHLGELRKGLVHLITAPAMKKLLIILVIFTISAFLFTSIFRSPGMFISMHKPPAQFAQIKDVGTTKVWPNVFTTVAEQNEVDFRGIIGNIGGKFLFYFSLFGILTLIFFKTKDGKYDPKYAILLAIWFIGTLYASTKGIRWVLLLVPAFSLAISAAAGFLYRLLSRWISKEFGVHKIVTTVLVGMLLLFIVFIQPKNMVTAAIGTARSEIPSMNDAWYTSLDMINTNASPNAIINSWWDFGHWFKAIGDRPVTFDGTSQNQPMAHWIGKVLLTDDEDLAIGILRMLDCGSNKAFDELDKVIKEPYKSVDLLYDVVKMDRDDARQALMDNGLTGSQSDIVLLYTHCEPPEDYFIASDDMIGKSGVWAHFGSWDFRKATIVNKLQNINLEKGTTYLQDEFGYNEDEAQSLYYEVLSLGVGRQANDWIAPWPSYASNKQGCSFEGTVIQCGNGLQFDTATNEASLLTQGGKVHPTELVMPLDDGTLLRKKYTENTVPFSAVLYPVGDSYQSVLMHPDLAASMFTLMFFMDGHSLKHFKRFSYQRSVFNNEIFVYKVDWAGTEPTVMPAITQQSEQLEERRIRHILVDSENASLRLLDQLVGGADFEELARNNSLDASAQEGGDIGWIRRGQTVAPFEEAAFALEVGELSEIVQTQFGYHIIEVLDVRNRTDIPVIAIS